MVNNKLAKIILVSVSLILIAGFITFSLEKTRIINLYNKPTISTTDPAIKPVNTVSYTPATTTDQDEASRLKQELIDRSNKQKSPVSKIDISLSAASQDYKGGPLVVRSILNVESGECKLVLSKNNLNKVYSTTIENTGTYNQCKGFDVPISDLENGKWQIKLLATSGQATGEISQEVEIYK